MVTVSLSRRQPRRYYHPLKVLLVSFGVGLCFAFLRYATGSRGREKDDKVQVQAILQNPDSKSSKQCQIKNPPRTLYYGDVRNRPCSDPWTDPLSRVMRNLFPTSNVECYSKDITVMSDTDIFYGPWFQPIRLDVLNSYLEELPGRILWFNSEVYDILSADFQNEDPFDYLPKRASDKPPAVVVGPHKDVPHASVQVHLLAWLLIGRGLLPSMLHDEKPQNTRKHFMLYVASHCIAYREQIAYDIATTIAPIHVGGKCHANVQGNRRPGGRNMFYFHGPACQCIERQQNTSHVKIISTVWKGPDSAMWHDANSNLFHNYRFALVLENHNLDGYVTEKILNAFAGGSIPIYYGTRQVLDIFNPKAFIFYDRHNPAPAMERIAHLESHPDEYENILRNEPILKDGMNTVNRYFSLSENLGDGSLRRKILQALDYEISCEM